VFEAGENLLKPVLLICILPARIFYNKTEEHKLKLKALVILLVIVISLIPVYSLYKYLQKIIRPKESFGRLFLYLFAGSLLVFVYTFLIVFVIKKLFPGA